MTKPLSEQVAGLEESNSRFRRSYDRVVRKNSGLIAERDDLQRQVQEARDEIDQLRAGRGNWPKPVDDFPCCGSQPTSYADDDHQDAEAIETVLHGRQGRIIPAPPLTVHDLEVAPVGSVVEDREFWAKKMGSSAYPWGTNADKWTVSAESVMTNCGPNATLTTPEAQ